jgi:hypothetical protein
VPPANNHLALSLAREKCWYSRFDKEINAFLTCKASHPDAKPDLIRGLIALKRGDPGPETEEMIRARRESYEKHPLRTAPLISSSRH